MKELPSGILQDFEPVEMCNLEYAMERGSHIDPHMDDAWLWGERLVTLNLLSDCILTFTHQAKPNIFVRVPLKRYSLIIVHSAARHEWLHAIDPAHVHNTRVAMTFRELSDEFKKAGAREEEGQKLLELALTFNGQITNGITIDKQVAV